MPATNDVYRIAVRMQGEQGQDVMNVWHCQMFSYVTGTDQEIADELVALISSKYQDLEGAISTQQSGLDMSVQNLTQGIVVGSQAFNPSFQGTLTGDTMPPQTSVYSFFRTGYARRIGKKFWGLMVESYQDGGLITSTISTILVTFLANWIGDDTGASTANGYRWGVYNENIATTFRAFIEAVNQTRLRTQRRRMPNVGS